MEPLEPRPNPPPIALKWWQETRGMPRRFGVGSLMAVTVTYALVFSVATALGAAPPVTAFLFVLLMTVTAGQVLLFGGKRPRLASLVAGAVLAALAGAVEIVVVVTRAGGFGLPLLAYAGVLLRFPFQCALGALLGYLAGAIVGGTFVVIEMLRRIVRRTH